MSNTERDYYGGHAADYARYRPTYPESLFEQLLELAPHRDLAWDVGTGNGQVAVRLGEVMAQVLATDLSERQLSQATAHPKVLYRAAEAQHSGLEDASVALITAATCVHWFDQEEFYQEALRVLSPGGVLAVWTYAPDLVSPDPIAAPVRALASRLAEDWPPGIEWVDEQYRHLPFPLPSHPLQPIDFSVSWSLEQLLGWIDTWSGVRRHRVRTGLDPLVGMREQLLREWPEPQGAPTSLELPLYYRVGRKAVACKERA